MNIRTSLSAAFGALVIVSTAASAQGAASAAMPRVDARQAEQQKRIEQGVVSGALTPKETQRLEREQAGITKAESKAKADGSVTPQERKHLHRMQNAASKDIAHQKHDAQKVVPATK